MLRLVGLELARESGDTIVADASGSVYCWTAAVAS